jgi:small basic protein (TIGR04137 family)
MSIHRSLKTKSGSLNQHRNVLTRTERIAKLSLEDRFDPKSQSALGLVKVRSIKAVVAKKKKAEGEAEGADAKAGAPAAAGKVTAKPAAGAAAKPAAGAAKGGAAKK